MVWQIWLMKLINLIKFPLLAYLQGTSIFHPISKSRIFCAHIEWYFSLLLMEEFPSFYQWGEWSQYLFLTNWPQFLVESGPQTISKQSKRNHLIHMEWVLGTLRPLYKMPSQFFKICIQMSWYYLLTSNIVKWVFWDLPKISKNPFKDIRVLGINTLF